MGRLRKDKGSLKFIEPKQNEEIEDPKLQAEVKNMLGDLRKHGTKVEASTSGLDIPPIREWWTVAPPLPSASSPSPTEIQITDLIAKAQSLSPSKPQQTKETQFMSDIISSGTLSDKLSALTLMVQSSPLHNTRALETLRGIAEKGKKREDGLKALRCVVDWWMGGGVPPRKLRYFRDQPGLLHPDVTDTHLVMWYFEDWLKKYFYSILQVLETLTHDTLPYVRTQSYNLIFTFLRSHPEQEQNLLRLGISGLADTTKPIPSKVTGYIIELLQEHPAMKMVVIGEVCERILKVPFSSSSSSSSTSEEPTKNKHIRFSPPPDAPKPKPTPSAVPELPKGTLVALQTLTQLILSSATENERTVARKLVKVYLDMFNVLVPSSSLASSSSRDKEEDVDGKEVKKDSKGRILEFKSKKAKAQTGAKDVLGGEENSKIMSTVLTGVNRAIPFAFGEGGGWDELIPLTHPLFHLTSSPKVTFNVSLQALTLLERIVEALRTSSSSKTIPSSKTKEAVAKLKKRYYRSLYHLLSDVDGRLGCSGKEVMFFNLLVRSMKALASSSPSLVPSTTISPSKGKKGKGKKVKTIEKEEKIEPQGEDEDFERLCSLLHRFLQLLVSGSKSCNPEFVEGGLVLVDQLFTTFPRLRQTMLHSASDAKVKEGGKEKVYDPVKREPEYANGSLCLLWELTPLLHHYHPTISLHASQLMTGERLSGASTDIGVNTVMHFLDRFVFKNPKKQNESSTKQKGPSHMQPSLSSLDDVGGERLRRVKGEQSASLASRWDGAGEEYLRIWEDGKRKGKKPTQEEEADEIDDGGSEKGSDAEEEGEIWKAMKSSMSGPAGDSDVDDDDDDSLDMEELDDELDLEDRAPGDSDSDVEDEEEDMDDASELDSQGDGTEGDDDDLASASDTSDLLPMDDLIPFPDAPSEDEGEGEWGGVSGDKKRKRGEVAEEENGKKKKKKKLPTFASYEDYAKMIEDGPEDFI